MRNYLVLFRRLLADPRLPRRRKAALAALFAYLLSPIDLIPDFIPVIGHLDDALVAAFALRYVLRGVEPGVLEELWPGRPEQLERLLRLSRRGESSRARR
jgi:uncharacterized membrane protein YkvA (DUF1232 family)